MYPILPDIILVQILPFCYAWNGQRGIDGAHYFVIHSLSVQKNLLPLLPTHFFTVKHSERNLLLVFTSS